MTNLFNCTSNMFNLIKIPFQDNKEQIISPFLCDQIKEFGSCKGPCTKRHALCTILDKECLNIPTKCFISIQLTKIISGSHFYGRILKYSTVKDPIKDEHWTKVNDSFQKIKDELKKFGSSTTIRNIHKTPIVGDMVVVETKCGEFCRAVVLDIINGWLTISLQVKLIDLGYIEEVNSNKVFVLPSCLKEFRPVSVEIIVSSVEPVREGDISNWPITTTSFIRNLLEPIIVSGQELVCKVELSLGITLWIDWMLVKKCINKCSHFVCKLYQNPLLLPRELIERNLAKTNSNLIGQLLDLSKDTNIWEKHLNNEKSGDNWLNIPKPNIPLFSCEKREINIDKEIKEQWAHFTQDLVYNVSVDFIIHPKLILLRNLQFNDRICALQRDIDEVINNKTISQLTCPTVGTICLAKAPEELTYNRVVIQQINDQTANLLFVDYGEFHEVEIETLLTIPLHLITKLPFQIIECSLSGFRDILPTDIVEKFKASFIQLANLPNIHLKVISSSTEARLTRGNVYEVVLFTNDININIKMADEFDMYVDNNQIQNILSSNEHARVDDEREEYNKHGVDDDEYDEEEELQIQLKFLKTLLKIPDKEDDIVSCETSLSTVITKNNSMNLDEEQIVLESTNFSQAIIKNNKCDKIASHKQDMKQENTVKIRKNFCLNCNVTPVVPQCFWHQDIQSVYLKLSVNAVINYKTTVTLDTISINVETNSVSYIFTAVLYGPIIEESFTCHESFDGVYIKAQKLVQVKYKWPRLLKCSKKHNYIIYDTEYITDGKDWSLWAKAMNRFKMLGLSQQLNSIDFDYDSESTDSDFENNKNTIFED